MPAVPAIVFLAAALACSFVGRVLLINPAFGTSTAWGFTVLFAPFGPLFFRMKYRELAYPTRYWRLAVGPLMLLFFLNGGSTTSMQSLDYLKNFGKNFGKSVATANTANPTEAAAGDTHFHLPVPGKVVAAAVAVADPKPVATAPTAAKPAASTPAATPSKAVAAAAAAMPAAPTVLSPADRITANRQEFERLAVWYDNLKHERGYLRKGDIEAVEAYNAEAAKYQAALQLAKNEQAELAKLTAKK